MRRPVSVAFMLLFLMSAVGRGDGCSTNKPTDNVITLAARQTTTDTSTFVNPMAGKPVVKDSAKVSWLTEPQFLSDETAETTAPGHFPLTVGYCKTDGSGNAGIEFPTIAISPQRVADTPALAVQYTPTEATNGKPFVRYLKIEWLESASGAAGQAAKPDEKDPAKQDKPRVVAYKVVANADVQDTSSDSRYKLWVYSGYTFLRSKNDFKDGYPELMMRVETRWNDGRIFMKTHLPKTYAKIVKTGCMPPAEEDQDEKPISKPDSKGGKTTEKIAAEAFVCHTPMFGIARIYGDMGLVGTAIVANGGETSTLGKIKQTFAANIGFGIGKTLLVSTLKDTDTSAFSAMFVPRLGMITIPADDTAGTQGRSAFNYSLNLRIENEPGFRDDGKRGGNFEGAYFEFGFGESEQYSRKKFPRLRLDALLPIGSGSDLFRFAGRLQIDAPRPFHKTKTDPKDPPDNLGNEVRISIVFNMDLLELAKRIGGK
jgi:hypothetical protein